MFLINLIIDMIKQTKFELIETNNNQVKADIYHHLQVQISFDYSI